MLKIFNGVTFLRILNLDPLPPNFISIIVGFVLGVCVQFVLTKKELINRNFVIKVITLSAATTYLCVLDYDYNKRQLPLGGIILVMCVLSVFLWTEGKKIIEYSLKNKLMDYFKVKKQEDEL